MTMNNVYVDGDDDDMDFLISSLEDMATKPPPVQDVAFEEDYI